MSSKLTESNAVVAQLSPVVGTNNTLSTGYVDLGLYESVAFYLMVGNATVATTAVPYQATTDQGGGPAEAMTDFAITALDGNDDNKTVIVEIRNDDLKVNDGFRYVNFRVSVASGGSGNHIAVLGVAGRPRRQPVDHIAAVDEIVTSE